MGVVVELGAATICFFGQCFPALVGDSTPLGQFDMIERRVVSEGYGGDVIQFKDDGEFIFAIHRVWTGNPREQRYQRLRSNDPDDRFITDGCINIDPSVYERLKSCCLDHTLTILP